MNAEADNLLFRRMATALVIGCGALSLGLGTYFGLAERWCGQGAGDTEPVERIVPSDASISFPATDIAFGDMRPGEKKEIVVTFRNEGASSLIMRKARSSCACVFATLVDNELKAGEEGRLKVLLIAEAKHGKIEYPVYVESDDPKHPFVKLKAVVTVDSGITPEPLEVDLGKMRPGERFQRFVALKMRDGCMEVRDVRSSVAWIKPDLIKNKEQGVTVRIEGAADAVPGEFVEKIALLTKDSDSPILYIPVKGTVAP